MAGSVCKVIILGNLGADPELKALPSGGSVCEMRIATSSRVKRGEQWDEKTEWHSIVCFGKTAENCAQYMRRGRQAYVEGRLQTRSWDDKNTGEKRYKTEIVAESVLFLGGAGERSEGAGDRSGRDDDGARGYLDRQRTGRNAAPQGRGDPPPEDFGPGGDDDDCPF